LSLFFCVCVTIHISKRKLSANSDFFIIRTIMNSVFSIYKHVKPTMIAIVGALLFLFMGAGRVNAATYYGKNGNAPNLVASWGNSPGGTGTAPSNFTTAGDVFIIENGTTMSASNPWTVGAGGTTASTIQINNGGTLTMGTRLLTLASCNFTNAGTFTASSGGVTISGTLVANSVASFATTGAITFSKTAGTTTLQGNVSGASLTFSGTADNSTFALNGYTMTLTGAITIPRPSANPITLAVGSGSLSCTTISLGGTGTTVARSSTLSISTGTVTASGNITSSGIYSYITFSGAGTLNAGGTFMSGTQGTFTCSTGTVNFNAGAQTVASFAYTFNNMTLSGSGAKTFSAVAIINGVLSMEGTATVTYTATPTMGASSTLQYKETAPYSAGAEWQASIVNLIFANTGGAITSPNAGNLAVTGTFTVNSGASVIVQRQLTVTGITSISGTANWTSTNGTARTMTFNNDVTLNSGSSWIEDISLAIDVFNFAGNFTNNATTFTGASTGLHTFSGTTKILSGSTATVIPSVAVTGSYTNNGTLTTSTDLGGAGSLTQGTTGVLNIGGTATITTLTASATGNSVNYTGTGAQTIDYPVSGVYYNLSVSGGGAKTLSAGGDYTVTNQLTLTSGLLTLGGLNLILDTAAPAVAGTFGTANMIVTDGAGEVRKKFTGLTSYLYPVGDNTSGAEYSPMTISFSSGIFGSGAYVGVRAKDVIDPNYTNPTGGSYLTRYWPVTSSLISSFSATVTGTFLPADVVGSIGNIITGRYSSGSWVKYDPATSYTISALNQMTFGEYTGINSLPIINTTSSPVNLSGFSYVGGLGPSTEQSFTVSGNDLATNITITPSANFEISTGTGGSFFATSPITLNVSSYTVPTTTINVRMKAGLSVGSIGPDTITVQSTGATTKNVICNGSVVVTPLITTSVASLTGLDYIFNTGPSTQQSFTVSGSNLTADVTVTPPTDYLICATVGGTYAATPLTFTASGGILTGQPKSVYVKLKSGLTLGSYVENVGLTSTNAVTKYVQCTGSVNSATINVSTFNLGGFIYSGAGPSGYQTVSIGGNYLSTNITVSAPTNFEVCLTTGGTYTASVTLTQSGGTVASTPVYVKLKGGLSVATYGPGNLTAVSTGAITQNVICNGQVVSTATNISSNNTLVGFAYVYNAGPSVEQSFTVSAALLTSNITVTPPSSNFEISLTSGSGYVSYPSTLPIPKDGSGNVNAVPVYVRLKSGLPVATYATQNIVLSSNASSLNIGCSGVVITPPTISAGSSPVSPVCNGTTVGLTSSGTGITNQYWSGPNDYYNTTASPSLGSVSATNAGTYSVTGSALSGVNILTNGNFDSGNTGFGSSYSYATPSSSALVPEAVYTVTTAAFLTPNSVHSGFGTCNDHTTYPSGTGKQMVVNGAGTAGVIVWSESVQVALGTSYQFSYWVQTVNTGLITPPAAGSRYPSQLQLYVNGVPAGEIYTASETLCGWQQFVYNTNSGSSSVLQLTLINQNTALNGNDFSLDDMVLQQVFPVTSTVDLTVNPILAPSLAVSASSNPVFSGTTVTFTATPTNGGPTPTYQWYVGGVAQSGATSSTYTYAPTNGQVVSCTMTSSLPCASPTAATNQVTMTVNPRSNYWVGTTSTDWSVLNNWSAGFPPASGDDVEYANGTNYSPAASRDLQLDQNRTIGSLVNSTARRLVIPAGKGLTVNNTISTNNNDTIIYIGSSSGGANGSLIYHNAVNNPVYATVEMYSKATYTAGNAVNNKAFWQYFGIPLRSVVANPTLYNAYVRKWYESGTTISNHWIQQANDSTLYSFKGYELCQVSPTTYYFHGALENGDFNSGQLAYTSTALYPGQHIFANPYTAAINIRNLTFGFDMESSVYMYNTGSFADWTTNNGDTLFISNYSIIPGQYTAVTKNTAGNSNIPGQVPSMQAMLVKVNTQTPTSQAFFAISYNSVAQVNTDQQRVKNKMDVISSDKVSTRLEVSGDRGGADRMWIFSDPTCTRNFDNGWDGSKMKGLSLNPQLYAVEPDGIYQIDAVSNIDNTELAFQAGTDINYTITVTNQNIMSKYAGLYLVDLVENKTIDISQSGAQYKFVAVSTALPVNRFKIVSRYYEKNAPDTNSQIKIFSSNGMVFVDNQSSQLGQMIIYDISGHLIRKAPFAGNTITSMSSGLIPGAYVVKCSTELEEITKRIIVR
jgi:hypothetical protein